MKKTLNLILCILSFSSIALANNYHDLKKTLKVNIEKIENQEDRNRLLEILPIVASVEYAVTLADKYALGYEARAVSTEKIASNLKGILNFEADPLDEVEALQKYAGVSDLSVMVLRLWDEMDLDVEDLKDLDQNEVSDLALFVKKMMHIDSMPEMSYNEGPLQHQSYRILMSLEDLVNHYPNSLYIVMDY